VVEPGQVLGDRYHVERVLRRGGMAVVFAAFDDRLRREVAVKVQRVDDPATRPRFDREVRTLAALDHPGLVRVYDAGQVGDDAFYVMELIAGPSLAERLADGPLGEDEPRVVGRQVADALAFIHERGIVHRDVKPSNILLAPDGHARLADFGIAWLVDASRLTSTGLIVGTARYLAPEQLTGEPVGPPADVYALALVLCECVTGQPMFGGTAVEIAARRLTGAPVVPPRVGPDLAPLLTEMVAADPRARPTARQVATRLAPTARPTVVWPLPEPRPAGYGRRVTVGTVVLAVAAVALAIAVVVVALVLMNVLGGRTDRVAAARPPTVSASPTTTQPATTAPPTSTSSSTTTSTTSTTAAATFDQVLNQLEQTISADEQAGAIPPNIANHVLHNLRGVSQGDQGGKQVADLVAYINDRAQPGQISPDAASTLANQLAELQAMS
jgi:eukaryotic-like serine/threonine-protein kinase